MTEKFDEIDQRMVDLLVADARMSINELASRAGIARTTAYTRLERLQTSGVITGFTAVVDNAKAGHPVAALIFVNLEQHSWSRARDELRRLPGLQHLFLTSGTFDAVLLVRMADLHALRDVILVELHGMPLVKSTQTIFVLDEEDVRCEFGRMTDSSRPSSRCNVQHVFCGTARAS